MYYKKNFFIYIQITFFKKPIVITPSVLYSNTKLLDKYNCTIPETWDDFYDTLHLILHEERKLNKKLSGYTGLFVSNIIK